MAGIPTSPSDSAPPLLGSFPQYANLYWNDKWGASNETTPARDQILRALANHKVVIFNEDNTNPYTAGGTKDYGIEDAPSRLRAMNSEILVGISVNGWTVNNVGGGGSDYWPFQTMLWNACTANDWWVRFTNGAGAIVNSDGDTGAYRLFDVTNPSFRDWYAANVRRYFLMLGYDAYDFVFFDEMHNTLAAIPTQASGKTPADIALFNESTSSRTVLSASARDAAWALGYRRLLAMIPEVLAMPNGSMDPLPSMIGRMVQGIYPATKPDNEFPSILAHFANTRRCNRLMFIEAEWGSWIPQWINQINLTETQLLAMKLISGAGNYLAQGSWATYRTACANLACIASIMDGVGQLDMRPSGIAGDFKHPWQYFAYAPGAFGVPMEYTTQGFETPRILTESINASGGTNGSGIYWRDFTKAKVAFNWQYNGGGAPSLTWSQSGASIAANTGAVIFK